MTINKFVFYFLAAAALILQVNKLAWANNTLFLPGDAFFPTTLTADDLEQLRVGNDSGTLFRYSSFGGYQGAFCGYAGYECARFRAVDEEFVRNLKRAYAAIRKQEPRTLEERTVDGKTTLVETNGVRVLFYPAEFEFPNYKLGLRYNEDWVNQTVRFGFKSDQIRLCCLVGHADAVMESWRDAPRVPQLPAELPDVELKPVPAIETPVIIPGRVKAFVLNSKPLSVYFDPEGPVPTICVVDVSGMTSMSFEDGKWKTEKQ